MIFAIWFRHLRVIHLAAAIACAAVAHDANLITTHLHDFLDTRRIYPEFLRRGNLAQPINDQYSVIVVYVLAIAVLGTQVIRRRSRSVSRMIILIVGLSCLTTTTLFHVILLNKGLVPTLAEIRNERLHNAGLFIEIADFDGFMSACRAASFECGAGRPTDRSNDLVFRSLLREIPAEGDLVRSVQLPTSISDATATNWQFAFSKQDEEVRWIVDMAGNGEIQARAELSFGMLVIIAHSIWISGGSWIVIFHSRRGKLKDR